MSDAPTGSREVQADAARKQALFRDVNDRIESLHVAHDALGPQASWICECANEKCAERVEMSIDEYEALRRHPTRFAVAPGDEHVEPIAEVVVERAATYWIVEKVGHAGTVAAHLAGRGA